MEETTTVVVSNTDAKGKEMSNMDTDKNKAEFIWTLQATWHLVSTRLDMDRAFDQPVCKKKKLRESGVTEVTVRAYECGLRWRNMLATYRKNAERSKQLGTAGVHWGFFRTMHEVLGRSREEVEAERQARLRGTRMGKAITLILPAAPQDVLQLYMELQEGKLSMWAQQKALEEKMEAVSILARTSGTLKDGC